MRNARKRGIIAPQDKAAGFGNVCHRAASTPGRDAADAEDVARRKAASPAAQLERRHHVRRAECIHQSNNEGCGIRNGGRRRGRLTECDRFGPMLLGDAPHGRSDLVERRIP